MFEWLRRLRTRPSATAPTVTPRTDLNDVVRIELAALTPEPDVYLGRAAYLALILTENLGRALAAAPTTAAKSALGEATAEMLRMHDALASELRQRGSDPAVAMDPHHGAFDDFQSRTRGSDYAEILVTCFLTSGFLLDFFRALAGGLPGALASRTEAALRADRGNEILARLLAELIAPDARLASRLALWGRRLVGDTMLVARDALERDGVLPTGERTEPAFSELIAGHSRRMDSLGLTA